jgi:hypothetical protein
MTPIWIQVLIFASLIGLLLAGHGVITTALAAPKRRRS